VGAAPGQLGPANEVYSPAQKDYDHAELILDRLRVLDLGGGREARGGDASGDEMIDEASRQEWALVIAGKGRAPA